MSKIHAEVLSVLVRREEWRAEDLAAELFLSEGAVRSHLNVLAELGLVHVCLERIGPGRPRHLYSISSEGRATFPNGYQHWLMAVLDVLQADHPEVYELLPAALVASDPPGEALLAESVERRLWLFRRHFGELGHQMQMTGGEDGARIEVFNCGSFFAARAHPWICSAERAWMQTHFPDREVVLESCMTTGATTCVFAVRRGVGAAAE